METVDQLFSALDAIHQNHLGRERLWSIFEFENLVVLVDVAKDIHLCSNLLSFVEVCCERSHLYAPKVSAKVYTIGIYKKRFPQLYAY